MLVRVAKAPPPPVRCAGAPSSPVRFHPTSILEAIMETTAAAGMNAVTAVAAVQVSPSKGKAKQISQRALGTASRNALAAGGALLGL